MNNYYSEKLSAERLRLCYEIASPRIKQYLKAEVEYVLEKITPSDLVLELGCGYGRFMDQIAEKAKWVVGIDSSFSSLELGQKTIKNDNCIFVQMDASTLLFPDNTFDAVLCIQNGISAFHIDQEQLFRESIRVSKTGGIILFSSYSTKFWKYRLEWFEKQSDAGLLGEINYDKIGNGKIICKDGFTASTVDNDRFLELASKFNVETKITEVDESSIFCEMIKR